MNGVTQPGAGPQEAIGTGWYVETGSNAVLIVDVNGEPVGWATDMTGTTSQCCQPIGRTLAQIADHAAMMAEAPKLAEACALLSRGMHLLTVRAARAGVEIHAEILLATEIARKSLERLPVHRAAVLGEPYPSAPVNDNGGR